MGPHEIFKALLRGTLVLRFVDIRVPRKRSTMKQTLIILALINRISKLKLFSVRKATAGPCGCWRVADVAAVDPLHHAGDMDVLLHKVRPRKAVLAESAVATDVEM
jgi:hypothetical protein